MKVVIVDDDQTVRTALSRYLTRCGYDVVGEAHDGESGLAIARRVEPDVVVMDLKMPNMTGTEAARALRRTHPAIEVIMHSAYDETAFRTVAEHAGATHYVVKGESPEGLLSVLADVASRRGLPPARPATSGSAW